MAGVREVGTKQDHKAEIGQKPPFIDQGSIMEIFTDLSLWSVGLHEKATQNGTLAGERGA